MSTRIPRLVDRTVVGTPAEVFTMLEVAKATGTLVYATAPHPMPVPDQRVWVRVRLRRPATAPTGRAAAGSARRRSRRRRVVVLVVAVLSAGGLFGLGWAAVRLLHAAASAGPILLAGLVVLAAALRRTRCPGLHCSGCRH